ncbi:hypothetical protein JTB14_032029 [Gonioctena quinquepunctata]|nr:hypothetical protein JTB14_032029 [Gonioctena quinquepunctata]
MSFSRRVESSKRASNNYLANVPKLQGRENYEEWSFAMENFLVLEGLSKCIDGTETENELVAKAKAKVGLSLNPSLYVHVEEATTAKEVWDTLKDWLENRSSMAEYVNQVIETSQKLSRTGLKLDTSLVGSLLLAGLSDRFAPMVMALEHSGIGITTDTIKSQLLDMQLDGGTNSTGGAFASKEVYSNEDSSSESPLEQSSGELVFSEEELSDETYVPEDEESLVVTENVRRSQREKKQRTPKTS